MPAPSLPSFPTRQSAAYGHQVGVPLVSQTLAARKSGSPSCSTPEQRLHLARASARVRASSHEPWGENNLQCASKKNTGGSRLAKPVPPGSQRSSLQRAAAAAAAAVVVGSTSQRFSRLFDRPSSFFRQAIWHLLTATRDAGAGITAFDMQGKREALPRARFPWRSSHVVAPEAASGTLSPLRSPPFVQEKGDS